VLGVNESKLRKAVSDLLRFLAAIIAGGVNDFGADGWSLGFPKGA
jgi:hypothetical protein